MKNLEKCRDVWATQKNHMLTTCLFSYGIVHYVSSVKPTKTCNIYLTQPMTCLRDI